MNHRLFGKRFKSTVSWLLTIHVLALVVTSLLRAVTFFDQRDLLSPHSYGQPLLWAKAFVRGLWFDNAVGCAILLVPLVVMLVVASLRSVPRWLWRGAQCWFGLLYAGVFAVAVASAAKGANWLFWGVLWFVATMAFVWTTAVITRSRLRLHTHLSHHHNHYVAPSERTARRVASLLLTVLLSGLCLLGVRGRVSGEPLRPEHAKYCADALLNRLVLSPAFEFVHAQKK